MVEQTIKSPVIWDAGGSGVLKLMSVAINSGGLGQGSLLLTEINFNHSME